MKLRINENPTASTSYETKQYIIPNVLEEDAYELDRFIARWNDKIEDYSWKQTGDGVGQFEILCDSFVFEMIVLWAFRHGLIDTSKSLSNYIPTESIRRGKLRNKCFRGPLY